MVLKNADNFTVVFLGNSRCYHTLDWFRSAQQLRPNNPPILLTDLIEGESYLKLIKPDDIVGQLLILDKFLFKRQSRFGNIWRNIMKLLAFPVQVMKLRKHLRECLNPVVHAHSMYYIALARFSSCKYVATPQGSELLVRPYRSRSYKMFARMALSRAAIITVDSEAMMESLARLCDRDAHIIQNGINLDLLYRFQKSGVVRDKIISVRGFSPNYQIETLLDARNRMASKPPIHFCYPFEELGYKTAMSRKFISEDLDLGRLPRIDLYRLLLTARLVISIPMSDSSPRSVYEAIFCGAFVAVTEGRWISLLSACMAARLIVVDTRSQTWLHDALDYAARNADKPYVPSPAALELFDQKRAMRRFYNEIYPLLVRT